MEDAPLYGPGRRYTPPWLFLFLLVPSGITQGFGILALPYWLSRAGVPMESVSAIVALGLLPYTCKPLLALLADLGPRRHSWYLMGTFVASLFLWLAVQALSSNHLRALSGYIFAANTAIATSESALIALCATTVRPGARGLSAGYYSVAQLCWGGIFGWLIITLREPPHALGKILPAIALNTIGIAMAVSMVFSLSTALFIQEPPHARRSLRPRLHSLFQHVWQVLRSTRGWTSLVICLAPLGTTAASNLFGALTPDYGVGTATVGLVTGIGAGLANAAGAMLGGFCADRIGPRKTYLGGAMALGTCALGMALCPPRPVTFIVCCLAYGIASGFIYAAFYSLVLELIGATSGATTTCGVFIGASNLALFYVTLLDGRMYRFGGRMGLLICDAACNWIGVLIVVAMLRFLNRRASQAPTAKAR